VDRAAVNREAEDLGVEEVDLAGGDSSVADLAAAEETGRETGPE